jgi:hypothetical protein
MTADSADGDNDFELEKENENAIRHSRPLRTSGPYGPVYDSETAIQGVINMGKKKKKLCKWNDRDIQKKLDRLSELVRKPGFLCLKCARVADDPKWLHKPVRINPGKKG